MLELLTYQNNEGEVLVSSSDVSQAGIFVEDTELRNFSWNVLSVNEKITGFNRKQIKTYNLPCKIRCITDEQGQKVKERLYRIAEKDVLANKPGRIWIAGYYMWCWVTESKKDRYLVKNRVSDITLVITTDKPYWIKEYKYEYRHSVELADGLNFPFNFPHNLGFGGAHGQIITTDFRLCDFKIVIYGAVNNPEIRVGNNRYKVNYSIGIGDTIEIDSIKKTLIKSDAYGNTESILFYRDASSYIFEKIDTENTSVLWDNTFNFDIIIYDTRSEPTWDMNKYIRVNNGTDVSEDVYVNNTTQPTDLLSADDKYY